MSDSFLERQLFATCPGFRDEWRASRAPFESAEATPEELLAALRTHVLRLLGEGRVAEVTRVCYTVERLLDGADPILEELLVSAFVVPLASDCRTLPGSERAVLPHLGPRARKAWLSAAP